MKDTAVFDYLMLTTHSILPLLCTRRFNLRTHKVNDGEILLRSAVRDLKPGGLYIEDDPEPLAIHHMVIEMRISYPMLDITCASAELKEFPHHDSPGIAPRYKQLEGPSIARGFTHKMREMFGGPRSCTHTTALLQAMAPVVIQCGWSMQMLKAQEILASGKELHFPLWASAIFALIFGCD